MCLSDVTTYPYIVGLTSLPKYGYQVIRMIHKDFALGAIRDDSLCRFDKWQEDESNEVLRAQRGDVTFYKTGFHIFLRKRDARKFLRAHPEHSEPHNGLHVVRVYFDAVTAVGKQLFNQKPRILDLFGYLLGKDPYREVEAPSICARRRYICFETRKPPSEKEL